MRSLIDNKDKFEVLEEMNLDSKFEVLGYYNKEGNTFNQIKITLDESKINIAENNLSYFKGDIEIVTNSAIKTISNKIFGSIVSKTTDKTILTGSGEVYLIPSSRDYTLIELVEEEIIVNSNMFLVCEGEINIEEIEEVTNEAIFSEDNQRKEKIRLSGSGIVALVLPVKKDEIKRMKIFRDVVSFKEDKVILRTENIEFELEDSETKEGKFNIYSGSGELWICDGMNIIK